MKETVSSLEEKQHNIGFLTFIMPLIFFICEGCFFNFKDGYKHDDTFKCFIQRRVNQLTEVLSLK